MKFAYSEIQPKPSDTIVIFFRDNTFDVCTFQHRAGDAWFVDTAEGEKFLLTIDIYFWDFVE